MTTPAKVLSLAEALVGVHYLWGGKTPRDGFDCSGLVTWCLSRAGVIPDAWRATHNSQRLADAFSEVHEWQRAGDLAFYGRSWSAVTHVMLVAEIGRAVGACGGDSTTTTREAAEQRGARVQYRSRLAYRRDYLGCRRPPYSEET